MEIRKEDHRVKYTKMIIKESLLVLMKERSINKITVTDICKKADINRNTFYCHYANQFELLAYIEEELYQEIRQVAEQAMNQANSKTLSVEICKYIKANKSICEVLFSENGDKKLLERILYISYNYTMERQADEGILPDHKLYDNWYAFTAYGTIAVIKRWVDGGMKESPVKIADFIDRATNAVSTLL